MSNCDLYNVKYLTGVKELKKPTYEIRFDRYIMPPWWAFWRKTETRWKLVGGIVELHDMDYETAELALAYTKLYK